MVPLRLESRAAGAKPRVERFNTHKTANVTINAWISTRKKKPPAACKSRWYWWRQDFADGKTLASDGQYGERLVDSILLTKAARMV